MDRSEIPAHDVQRAHYVYGRIAPYAACTIMKVTRSRGTISKWESLTAVALSARSENLAKFTNSYTQSHRYLHIFDNFYNNIFFIVAKIDIFINYLFQFKFKKVLN